MVKSGKIKTNNVVRERVCVNRGGTNFYLELHQGLMAPKASG